MLSPAESDLDDNHLCIKCNSTVVGLTNYVEHRKTNCIVVKNIHRDIVHEDHAYGTFVTDFSVQTTNYDIEIDHDDQTPSARSKDLNAFKSEEANKSLSDQYDYNYELGADIFFSSLQLQSSTKLKQTNSIATSSNKQLSTTISPQRRTRTRKTKTVSSTIVEHEDDWIPNESTSQAHTDKLMKAVNEISGTKRVDSVFNLMRYAQDSPEPYEDEDEDENDYHQQHQEQSQRVPLQHTGGKWKPSAHTCQIYERRRLLTNSPQQWFERDHWEISDEPTPNDDSIDFLQPPPSYTKGKWVPGTKIVKLDYKPDLKPANKIFTDKYWCKTCNRKLASLVVYERHLKSNLHKKRLQPETELDEASRQIVYPNSPKRTIKPSIYLNDTLYSTQSPKVERKSIVTQTIPSTVTSGAFEGIIQETNSPPPQPGKRKRQRTFIKCEVCKTRLPKYLLAKHLISHYHYRRMHKNPYQSYAIILKTMSKIVLQSPFQCHPCRFYANTEDMFFAHWSSKTHTDLTEGPGRFWCSFCKFECEDNNQMRRHLTAEDHQEVVLAINRSVPIIIRKRTIIKCEKCGHDFHYNIELRQHSLHCSGSVPLGTASNEYQSKYTCSLCNYVLKSRISLQRHELKNHSKKSYFCSLCDLSFEHVEYARRHRMTTEHKINSIRVRCQKSILIRKCKFCQEVFDDLIKLKEHVSAKHPNELSSCIECGKTFTIPQELSRHVRDKVCEESSISYVTKRPAKYMTESNLYIQDPTILNNSYETSYLPTLKELNIVESRETTKTFNEKIIENYNNDDNVYDDVYKKIAITKTISDQQKKQPTLLSSSIVISSDENAKKDVSSSYFCTQCKFSSTSKADHLYHEILKHKKNIVKNDHSAKIPCTICGKAFKKRSLRFHLRQHTNERNFKCDLCSALFARRSNLKDHVVRIHCGNKLENKKKSILAPKINTFKCTICEKSFLNRHRLEQHYFCHRDQLDIDKTFSCLNINCMFIGRSAAELRVHESCHSNDRKFSCSECNYVGKTIGLLKRHMKHHWPKREKEPIFLCNICNYKSDISGHMKRHLLVHTGEKPYKCPHCTYSCNNSENLKKHVSASKIHPGRKLYECRYCNNEYGTNMLKEFQGHLKKVHNQTFTLYSE